MILEITRPNVYSDFDNLPKIDLRNVNNLFVISNVGQLKHSTTLIKKKKLLGCFLLVVYTEANLTVPQIIHDCFDSSIFDSVLFFRLPTSPNSILFSNIKFIEKNYQKVIKGIRPQVLYLNSFQFHYAVLAKLARDAGVKLVLIEEGLGTYRLQSNENYKPKSSINFELIKELSKETVSQTELFKILFQKYKLTQEFLVESKKLFRKIYLSPEVQSKLISVYPNKNYKNFFIPFIDFDESYTSFPDLTQKIFSIKKNHYYFSFEEPTREETSYALSIINKYNIQPKDYIYLSQKYNINRNEYLSIVKSSLLKLLESSDSIIFVKLHPKKEHELVMEGFLRMEKETEGRIRVIKESGFLIEEVIKLSKVQGVIGITSSALVYSPLISPNCKPLSIAHILVKKLLKHKRNEKGVDMIKEHTKILENFDNITFLK